MFIFKNRKIISNYLIHAGGVTLMDDFLKEFFPVVYKRTQQTGLESNYCKYNNQWLQLFTSSLYVAALVATFFASYTTRKRGRTFYMLMAGIFFLVGVVLNAVALNYAYFWENFTWLWSWFCEPGLYILLHNMSTYY